MGQNNRRKPILYLLIATIGVFAGALFVVWMQQNTFPLISQPWRKILAVAVQWIPATVPIIVAVLSKDQPADLGFKKEKIASQIIIGVLIAGAMSLVLTVLPLLLGMKDYIGSDNGYPKTWMFLYEFVYCTVGVALSEELVFRGILFHKALQIKNSKVFAIFLSSALFGLFHILNGNVVQLLLTALIGAFLCFCREKIKNCTTVSLIIAHGLYDACIVVWCAVL